MQIVSSLVSVHYEKFVIQPVTLPPKFIPNECEINGQVAYFRDTLVEIEVKLCYPDYDVYYNKELMKVIPLDELIQKTMIRINPKIGNQAHYYLGFCEAEEEVFIMRKCDGDRKSQQSYNEIQKNKRLRKIKEESL